MKTSEIAARAATWMAEHGHCKNRLLDNEGRVCLAGAVRMTGMSCSGSTQENEILRVAGDILTERGYVPPVSPPWDSEYLAVTYNNESTVTGEDVILLLKETAERLAANEGV